MWRRLRDAAVVAVALVVLAATGAEASFSNSAAPGSGMTLATATLQPPTSPGTAFGTCISLNHDTIVVSWSASSSSFTDGYQVLRATTNGGPYTVVATLSSSAFSYSDTNVSFSTTYYYVIRATKLLWTSATTAQVQRTTRTALCLV